MAIVKVHNKQRGITYVYESESYWDKELKQPRSNRKLIGKLDPETGEIIPTGPRGRKKTADVPRVSTGHSDTDYQSLYESVSRAVADKDAVIAELRQRLSIAEKELSTYRRSMKKSCEILLATLDKTEGRTHG